MAFWELINFSVYDFDISRYGGDWNCLRKVLKRHDIDGIELLTGFGRIPHEIPEDLVTGVHFPSFMGWYRIWNNDFPEDFSCSDSSMFRYLYGGRTKNELIANFCSCIRYASEKNPSYGVFHAGYMEYEHTFQKKKQALDSDVVAAAAEYLNAVAGSFSGGEPPFDIAIENLWWPGLTFLDPELTMEFMDMLEFERWFFMLDTGHLMNAAGNCLNENDGIRTVISVLSKHDRKVLKKIKGLHFHFSASGNYQKKMSEPENFCRFTSEQKADAIMKHLRLFDEHRPFTSKECLKITDLANPEYLTHEFLCNNAAETEMCLHIQKNALKRD